MKKLIIAISIITFAQVSRGDTEKLIASKIKEATVYLRGAEIQRTANVQIGSGITELIFEDLSTTIDPNTIEVSGMGGIVVQSATFRTNYIRRGKEDPRIISIRDSIDLLSDNLDLIRAQKFAYQEEQKLIIENRKIGGEETGLSIAELQKASDFFRTRLAETNKMIARFGKQDKEINQDITRLNNQLRELNAQKNKPTGEIVVKVSAKKAGSASLKLKYYLYQAGWSPLYDLRVDDINSNANLMYKANVWQNSGKSWDNIQLTLSTGNPSRAGNAPQLVPWRLSFYEQIVRPQYRKYKSAPASAQYMMDGVAEKESMSYDDEIETVADYTQVTESALATKFEISLPYTIPSNNKRQLVDIQNYTMPAKYEHLAIPKMNLDAFLLARVSGWEDYQLLSGPVNIFFENSYVGKSHLNVQATEDTLNFSLGRDQGVIVKRDRLRDFEEKRIFGTKKRESFVYELTVRNTKSAAISIDLFDQIPISSNEDIKVVVEETGVAHYNKNTGELKWKLDLAPSSSKKVKFSFYVEYPEDKKLADL